MRSDNHVGLKFWETLLQQAFLSLSATLYLGLYLLIGLLIEIRLFFHFLRVLFENPCSSIIIEDLFLEECLFRSST